MIATEEIQSQFELAISLVIARWDILSIAVANQWGGPDSADKRDWLCGAISDLFQRPEQTVEEDVEETLIQIMFDEFETKIEDESEIEVADQICRLRKYTLEGDFTLVEEFRRRWEERQQRGVDAISNSIIVDEQGSESDDDEDDEDRGVALPPNDMDTVMDEAPQLVPAREKPAPEIDQDGFIKVVGKNRR